jgi:hypothetical protein
LTHAPATVAHPAKPPSGNSDVELIGTLSSGISSFTVVAVSGLSIVSKLDDKSKDVKHVKDVKEGPGC